MFFNIKDKKIASLILLAIFFVTIDRLLKSFALHKFSVEPIVLTNWLKLSLDFNPNISFSIPLNGIFLNILIIIIILILIIYFIKLLRSKNRIQAGLLLFIILGASSNLLDRFLYNAVIDYIDISYFTIFNIADSMIIMGAFFLIINKNKFIRRGKNERRNYSSSS